MWTLYKLFLRKNLVVFCCHLLVKYLNSVSSHPVLELCHCVKKTFCKGNWHGNDSSQIRHRHTHRYGHRHKVIFHRFFLPKSWLVSPLFNSSNSSGCQHISLTAKLLFLNTHKQHRWSMSAYQNSYEHIHIHSYTAESWETDEIGAASINLNSYRTIPSRTDALGACVCLYTVYLGHCVGVLLFLQIHEVYPIKQEENLLMRSWGPSEDTRRLVYLCLAIRLEGWGEEDKSWCVCLFSTSTFSDMNLYWWNYSCVIYFINKYGCVESMANWHGSRSENIYTY